MKPNLLLASVTAVILGGLLAGCGGKPSAEAELQRAAVAIEQAPAPVPAPAPAPAPDPAQPAPQAAPPPADTMNQAIAAYKSGNLEDAVTRLHRLRATPTMTPEQRIALNDAMAAVMAEIYTMAEKGDRRALQAVWQYEQMQAGQRR